MINKNKKFDELFAAEKLAQGSVGFNAIISD